MIEVQVKDFGVAESLKLLALPAAKRKRLLWRAAKGIVKLSKANIRNQQTPDGTSWERRKRGKGKMLRGLGQLIVITEKPDAAIVRLSRGSMDVHAGIIGSAHQHGHDFKRTAEQAAMYKRPDASLMSTRMQAKKLRKLGYTRPGKKAGKRAPASLKWIQENLSYNQAGLLIRKLSKKEPKRSWTIRLPSRPFIGATQEQRQKVFAEALRSIDYGWNVKAQNMRR